MLSEAVGNRPGNMAALSDDFSNKLVQTRCIHTACNIRDKAQRPSAVISQPSGQLTWSTLELRAQFQPHQRPKRKKHHTCKDVLLPENSCENGYGQSLEHHWERKVLAWLQTMQWHFKKW